MITKFVKMFVTIILSYCIVFDDRFTMLDNEFIIFYSVFIVLHNIFTIFDNFLQLFIIFRKMNTPTQPTICEHYTINEKVYKEFWKVIVDFLWTRWSWIPKRLLCTQIKHNGNDIRKLSMLSILQLIKI